MRVRELALVHDGSERGCDDQTLDAWGMGFDGLEHAVRAVQRWLDNLFLTVGYTST